MSATTKAEVVTRLRDASLPEAPLLDEIVSRMDVIEARQSRPSPVHLRTWEEIERFADKAARSGMVPKDYVGKPDAICIAIQMGSELGLAPMQALQNIAVVNGRPSLWGDALPALCRASGICAYIREWSEGSGDSLTYWCEAKRKDDPNPIRNSFSVAQAKKASLWKTEPRTKKRGRDGEYEVDSGPWYSYPDRMLQMRARGFALRDAFPDVLKGLITAEEAQDIPFEATGLTPTMPHPTARVVESNGVSMPVAAPKRTWGTWLDDIEAAFAGAATRDAVDAVLASEDVQKAQDAARNAKEAVRERLGNIVAAALVRFPDVAVGGEGTPDPLNEEAPDTTTEPDPLGDASTQSMLDRVNEAASVAALTSMQQRTNGAWRQEYDMLPDDGKARVNQRIEARLGEMRGTA
jgi:RecT family